MIEIKKLDAETQKLLCGEMTWNSLEKLELLLSVRDGLARYCAETPMDCGTAREWTGKMKNSDGTRGEHWTMEQTTQVLRQRGWDCSPAEFYAVMNSLWSDYGRTAQRYGADKVDFWADLAHDWLQDEDAAAGKAERYYREIVEH